MGSHTLAPIPYTLTMEITVVEGEDEDVYACEASDTVLTLKEKIEAKEAFPLDSQYLYHEGYWLSEDDAVLSEFLSSGEELTLTLPFASGGKRRFEEGEEIGGKKYHVERYVVGNAETEKVVLTRSDGRITVHVGERLLENIDIKVYDESKDIARWVKAKHGSRIAYYIGAFGLGIASLVFGVL